MDLNQLRQEIDAIDRQLVELFVRRMDVCARIGDYKKENGLPILSPIREREKLTEVMAQAGPEMASYVRALYPLLFELSRSYQSARNQAESPLFRQISQALETTPKLFPQQAMVACQGVEGAYSQIACEKIFRDPMIVYCKNFDGVFSAVEQGLCRYGVVPIENSTAGSVGAVYDRMLAHDFYIARSTRLKIDHCLLARPGVRKEDIREIYSHEQAISQCSRFLETLPGVKITPVENTAVAAQLVAASGRSDAAALSSRACGELYGLTSLADSVQDAGNNHTRFLCICRKPEIYPGADKTSILLTLPHKPGALYKVLSRIYVLGINVTKLESRPMPDRDFEFMFYLDLETSVYSQEFARLMCELDGLCETFQYLGSYSEVI